MAAFSRRGDHLFGLPDFAVCDEQHIGPAVLGTARELEDGAEGSFHLGATEIRLDAIDEGLQMPERLRLGQRRCEQVLDRGAEPAQAQVVVVAQASHHAAQGAARAEAMPSPFMDPEQSTRSLSAMRSRGAPVGG